MKILIAGAGSVGTHLAKLLSKENQDVILMDADKEKLNFFRDNIEMLTMNGSPTSLRDLEEAGVKNADIFIAVTQEESVNVTACLLASRMGAKDTCARIDNFEYLLPKNKEFFSKIGINEMVYPEMLAAREIEAAIQKPWTRFCVELCGGAIVVAGVKIRSNSQLVDKQLKELGNTHKLYHIVAIKRNNTTIIPNGNDFIRNEDIVFFATTNNFVSSLPLLAGKDDFVVKNIMLMGGSRIAIRTCQYLANTAKIKLLEVDKEKCVQLLSKLPKSVTVFNDDGRNDDFLLREGIENTDAFVAVTGNSEANILACLSAKRFGVRKTVAEVENMDYIQMAEKLDIGTIINKKLITINNIYRFLLKADISTVKTLAFANADVAEIVARPNSRITKKEIKRQVLPPNITLGGLIRNNEPMMIDGDTQVQAYDHVVVFCLEGALREIEKFFE